ncbi:MAG: SDR family NAD(P)-dependent oxidoreductase [Planctomycetes bacterium]|nr:SDR family NAD(P)-dependent oxidoreductase [Planctomycetota bacterium]
MISFSKQDIELFARASGDNNPMHTSDAYAHKTAFGQPVVFGVLAAIAAISRIEHQSNCRILRIELNFPGAIFVEVDYSVDVETLDSHRFIARILDGSRIMLTAEVDYDPSSSASDSSTIPTALFERSESALCSEDELGEGHSISGNYSPCGKSLTAVIEKYNLSSSGFGLLELGALCWASYCVGMELPGRNALFGKLMIDFDTRQTDCAWPVEYRSQITANDQRFDLVRCEATLLNKGTRIARAELRSFVRRDVPPLNVELIRSLLGPTETLAGKVAVVTGASRGLGAAIAAALVYQGCTVFANYRRSRLDAEQLVEKVASATGKLVLVQGDAGDPAWWRSMSSRLLQEYDGLDLLVCNACPPLVSIPIDSASTERINTYINQSVSLVSEPLGACAEMLARRHGSVVVVSSVAVDEPVAQWPHYVAAKSAIEGLARTLAVANENINVVIIRPPRLRTELTNVPMGHSNAVKPELVAVELVSQLAAPKPTGEAHFLMNFDTSSQPVC